MGPLRNKRAGCCQRPKKIPCATNGPVSSPSGGNWGVIALALDRKEKKQRIVRGSKRKGGQRDHQEKEVGKFRSGPNQKKNLGSQFSERGPGMGERGHLSPVLKTGMKGGASIRKDGVPKTGLVKKTGKDICAPRGDIFGKNPSGKKQTFRSRAIKLKRKKQQEGFRPK